MQSDPPPRWDCQGAAGQAVKVCLVALPRLPAQLLPPLLLLLLEPFAPTAGAQALESSPPAELLQLLHVQLLPLLVQLLLPLFGLLSQRVGLPADATQQQKQVQQSRSVCNALWGPEQQNLTNAECTNHALLQVNATKPPASC